MRICEGWIMEVSSLDSLWDGKLFAVEHNGKLSFTGVCRLCGNGDSDLVSIYGQEGVDNDLQSKIVAHLPVQIVESDCLPHTICSQCTSTLVRWHHLTVNCMKVDEKFREILRYVETNGLVDKPADATSILGNEVNPEVSMGEENESCTSHEIVYKLNPVSADNRFQEQENQMLTVSDTEAGKELMNSSFSLLKENENIEVYEDLKENEILNHPSASSISVSNVLDKKYFSIRVDGRNSSNSSLEENSKVDCTSSDVQRAGSTPCDKGRIHLSKNGDALCMLSDGHQDISFQLTLDHNYVLPSTNLNVDSGKKIFCETQSTIEKATAHRQSIYYYAVKPYVIQIVRISGDAIICKVLWKRSENNYLLQCNYCEKNFRNVSVLQTHSRFHTGVNPFYCKFCGKNYCLSASLREHLKTCSNNLELDPDTEIASKQSDKDSERMYACEFCGKKYKLKASLKEHFKQHEGRARMKLKCEICGARFLKKAEVMEHAKLHDTNTLSSCNICEKTFLNERDLEEHKISHSNVRPFTCFVCGMSYKRKSHLTRHVLIHTASDDKSSRRKLSMRRLPGEEFKCELCDKICRTRHLLSLHMVSHTGERNHVCCQCGKGFGQAGALSRHLHTVHRGAKDFRCEVCNRCFTAKATKDNHMRIHTGEKPYQCAQCGKAFRTYQQHKLHEKIHSDVRPYACQYCEKRFRRRPHLIVHIRTHTGEKPYGCSICGRCFAQKNDLNKHMKIHRKDS